MTIDWKALMSQTESGSLIVLRQIFFTFKKAVSVCVVYKLLKPDPSTEDELHHVQRMERGITRMQKNAAQTDSERKRCPTAALVHSHRHFM